MLLFFFFTSFDVNELLIAFKSEFSIRSSDKYPKLQSDETEAGTLENERRKTKKKKNLLHERTKAADTSAVNRNVPSR